LEFSGEGKYIIDQDPKPETVVEAGSTLRLYLAPKNLRE